MLAYAFTPGEQRVAWTLFPPHTNADSGAILQLSPQTVKNHLSSMLRKTRTRNRLELVMCLLDLEDEPMPAPMGLLFGNPPER